MHTEAGLTVVRVRWRALVHTEGLLTVVRVRWRALVHTGNAKELEVFVEQAWAFF